MVAAAPACGSLAMNREKKTCALPAGLGAKPGNAAISFFNSAARVVAKIMPQTKAEAIRQTELSGKAGISESNLSYLRDAKRTLTFEQAEAVDDLLLGILSVFVSRQVWEDSVQMAARMARREKP